MMGSVRVRYCWFIPDKPQYGPLMVSRDPISGQVFGPSACVRRINQQYHIRT
jgi:hypothetical protein